MSRLKMQKYVNFSKPIQLCYELHSYLINLQKGDWKIMQAVQRASSLVIVYFSRWNIVFTRPFRLLDHSIYKSAVSNRGISGMCVSMPRLTIKYFTKLLHYSFAFDLYRVPYCESFDLQHRPCFSSVVGGSKNIVARRNILISRRRWTKFNW